MNREKIIECVDRLNNLIRFWDEVLKLRSCSDRFCVMKIKKLRSEVDCLMFILTGGTL